jgi:hypothetical protein
VKPGSAFRQYFAIAAWALLAGGGCGGAPGGGGGEPPRPALGASPAAGAALRAILQRFASASRADRLSLKPDLLAFRRRFAGDDLARVADAHLAWIALEEEDLGAAEALAAAASAAGPGVTDDLARVVRGAARRRAGKPREALASLRPLLGKLIDPYVRAFLNEEVVTAAMAARAWPEVLALLGVWLREAADDERPALRAQVAVLLAEVPVEHLERALRLGARGAPAVQQGAPELELRALLAARLAVVARERRDVKLANDLLRNAGSLLGAQGEAIAQIVAGAATPRVEAPTVGVLLPVRTPEAQRRSVEIAAGVAHGLGLPGSAARLVSRDDGAGEGSVDEALTGLSADGAAVLIAGADRAQATAAAAFARARSIPVLLLHPPEPEALDGAFVFVVGEEPARSGEALAAALAERGAAPVAMIGEGPAAGVDPVALRLPCGAPLDARALREAGVQGLALNGDAACADRALLSGPSPRTIALGLEATVAAPAALVLVATAGPFPFAAAPGKSAPEPAAASAASRAGEPRPTIEAWRRAHPAPPGFWAALGRDAGVLAWAGVRDLPLLGTDDPAEVLSRRRAAAAAMASAKVELWTTDADGFGGARVLPRRIGVREVRRKGR